MFIGQNKLLDRIRALDEIPKFILLVGDEGSGEEHIVDTIATRVNAIKLVYEELKVDNIRELINDSFTLNTNTLYYLRCGDDMTEQAENALLKIAEEPSKYCYIVLGVTNLSSMLPTIQSRATILNMDKYSKQELRAFVKDMDIQNITNDTIYKVANTPGKVLKLMNCYDELYSLCEKLYQNIGIINYANLFKLTTYLDIKKNGLAKYTVKDFLKTLLIFFTAKIDEFTFNDIDYKCVVAIQSGIGKLKLKGANYQMVVDDVLVSLRTLCGGE